MSGSTITGTVTFGITLGNAGYYSPLTVEQNGKVSPSENTVAGVLVDSGLLTNNGTIVGGGAYFDQIAGNGVDASGGEVVNDGLLLGGSGIAVSGAFTSGAGIDVSGGTLENDGTIMGGKTALSSGNGVTFSNGTVVNAGTIAGNTGYVFDSRAIYGIYGGTGILMYGGTLTNTASGLITGADGGSGATGGLGGYGVILAAGAFINEGTVAGGNGGTPGYGPGGTAFKVTGGVLTNYGTILGGSGGYPGHSSFVEAPGNGVSLDAGLIVNDGVIIGGEGFNRGQASGFGGGFGLYLKAGSLLNNGTIGGGVDTQGKRSDAIKFGTGVGTLVVEPSATFLGDVVANNTASDTLELSANATASVGALDMGGSFSGFSTIAFDADSTWQLRGTAVELAAGQVIDGFTFNDTIFLDGLVATSYSYVSGTGLEISSGATEETLNITGGFSTSSFLVTSTADETEIELLCYLRGTRILTPVGEVAVESLAVGDPVVTRLGGYQKIKWIGRQSFGSRFIRNNRHQIPVRVHASAFGPGLPKRDLCISPGHSMLLGGMLVLARDLVNGVTVTQDDLPDEVHYYQLEFEKHDCVLAEGSWSESFCDYGGLRNQFHNVAEFWRLYPEHVTPEEHLMCAPRPERGPVLNAVLNSIVERATARVPLGPLQGVIDEVQSSGLITGWAIDVAHPELPILLEILLNDRLLARILACSYRPDLAAANLGQGRCSFALQGSTIAPESLLNIRVRRFQTEDELPFGPHCLAAIENAQQKRA